MNNILINKNQLNDYLLDFHPDKKKDILEKFKDFNFDCGRTSFYEKMKRIISMPKFGKRTLIYWTSRGWSEEEAFEKRIPVDKDPETSPMNINFWVRRGYSVSESEFQVKSQRKLNKEYWIKRGYSDEDSVIKSSEFQKDANKKYQYKLKTDISFKENVNSKMPNNMKYWLKLGFSEAEAKLKISERQSTFSLDKCIKKNGEEKGREIWKKRQEKWKISLEKSIYNGKDDKDSKSIIFFKKKYGENWIDYYLLKVSFKDKKKILYLTSFRDFKQMIDSLIMDNYKFGDISYILRYKVLQEIYSCNYEQMLSYLKNNCETYSMTPEFYHKKYENWVDKFIEKASFKNKNDIKKFLSFNDYKELIHYMIENYKISDINIYIQSKLISYFYNTTHRDMFNFLMIVDPTIKYKFGRLRYFNNHLCRSDSEYIIAKFLLENGIDYEYEKKYQDSLKRCDFYLTKQDFYIEYMGMYNIKSCLKNYNDKLKFCLEKNIKCFFSNKVDEIKNKIMELYEI